MKTKSVVRWMLLGFVLSDFATAVAATAEVPAEPEVRSTNELRLIGIMRSDPSLTIFVSHNRAKSQRLDAIGAAIGPYELRAIDPDQGFADFARDGAIYRVWLPEAVVRPGRFSLQRIPPPLLDRVVGVSVVGSVNSPTLVPLVPNSYGLTIAQAISGAGGPNQKADLKRVKLTRKDAKGEMVVTEIDVDAIVANRGRPVVRLQIGDVIEVPARTSRTQ